MKKNDFYDKQDYPSDMQKANIWKGIEKSLPSRNPSVIHMHWKSFWLGSAAALLVIFAGVGMYQTTSGLFVSNDSTNKEIYNSLNLASEQLQNLTPILIEQAKEINRPSIESTAGAIKEIDLLIIEIKSDIQINGITPAKEQSLKRLYATKLDFYKELLLNQEDQS